MTSKSIRDLLSIILILVDCTRAGLISVSEDHHEPHNQHLHHVSVASSFMHFHGPVEGPEFEVKIPHLDVHHHHSHHDEENNHLHYDHGHVLDYVAHPKYKFSYGVEDHHTGDYHSQKESRDGSSVSGEYSVMEPGGNLRIVSYRADKDGFHAVVHHSGKNDHTGYGHGHQPVTIELPQAHHGIEQQHHYQESESGSSELGEATQEVGQEQYLQEYPVNFSGQEEGSY